MIADGLDDSLAVFGRPALENIARGFGLRGHEIRDLSLIPKLFADFVALIANRPASRGQGSRIESSRQVPIELRYGAFERT